MYQYLLYGLLITLTLHSCKVVNNDSLSKTSTAPSNNSNYVYLNDVRMGKELDRARMTSDAKYFDYLMSNELNRDNGKPVYETVLATSDKVFYGVLRKNPINNQIIIDPFYAAPIENISLYFPGFEDIDGTNVKAKIFYSQLDKLVQTQLLPVCESSYSYNYKDLDIALTDKGIRVDAVFQGKCYEQVVFGIEFSTILDPQTLDVIQYYYELKNNNSGEYTEEGYVSDTEDVLGKGVGGKLKDIF